MFVLPYHVDVPMHRVPWMNSVLIGVTILIYPFCYSGGELTPLGESLVLGGDSALGWVGHVFVHDGLLHLLGNMIFLWVFGNSVCAKVGNLAYPFLYLGLGAGAGLIHFAITGQQGIGASGAINGIVGMYVVWYLLNDISCLYFYWLGPASDAGTFEIPSFWMVLFWLLFDIWGAVTGSEDVAYWAHVGGFVLGFGLAIALLKTGWVEMEEGERSLLQAIGWDEVEDRQPKKRSATSRPAARPRSTGRR